MKIAVPVSGGKLSSHFGHCEAFAMLDVEKTEVIRRADEAPPPHAPGVLPAWLAERGVTMVIAGGMGPKALELFAQNNIRVVVGAPVEAPEILVSGFLEGSLVNAGNGCNHGDGHVCSH